MIEGRDSLLALRAKQHYFIAGHNAFNLGHVDHGLIHAHAAH